MNTANTANDTLIAKATYHDAEYEFSIRERSSFPGYQVHCRAAGSGNQWEPWPQAVGLSPGAAREKFVSLEWEDERVTWLDAAAWASVIKRREEAQSQQAKKEAEQRERAERAALLRQKYDALKATAKGFKKRTVEVPTAVGAPTEVSGFAKDGLLVHRPLERDLHWTVTHLASGLGVTSPPLPTTLTGAKVLAQALLSLTDWTVDKEHLPANLGKMVGDVLREHRKQW